MKLLLILVEDSHKEEVEAFLASSGVPGYTEIPHAVGSGATGPRLGSRAFPKTSAVIFSLIEEDALQRLRDGIRSFCADCGERVRMVVLNVEEVLDGTGG
jgi:nitrogen regulatory protein P-II